MVGFSNFDNNFGSDAGDIRHTYKKLVTFIESFYCLNHIVYVTPAFSLDSIYSLCPAPVHGHRGFLGCSYNRFIPGCEESIYDICDHWSSTDRNKGFFSQIDPAANTSCLTKARQKPTPPEKS